MWWLTLQPSLNVNSSLGEGGSFWGTFQKAEQNISPRNDIHGSADMSAMQKKPGCLGSIVDYTILLYRECSNKPLEGSLLAKNIMECNKSFLVVLVWPHMAPLLQNRIKAFDASFLNSRLVNGHPDPWGNDPNWWAYFSNRLKPPTRYV